MIDTESFSTKLRNRAIDVGHKKILIARLSGSEQEKDLTAPVNCHGYGRIRHFKLKRYADWSTNPLPILPAAKALNYEPSVELLAQVFQNGACNWRCWYCYVDFDRLSADRRVSDFFTATELVDMFLEEENRAKVIDLSGGQPDLTPEWILWTMEALQERGVADQVFLWSDDNLSNRYFWQFLSSNERQYITSFLNYARVACFKGYDEASFTFNTLAKPSLFSQQFEIFQDLLKEGLDMYAYVTFTAPSHTGLQPVMSRFVDQLQAIHPNLPLRTVPLKIEVFTPTKSRVEQVQQDALSFQFEVHNAWLEELDKRFTKEEREVAITDIQMYR